MKSFFVIVTFCAILGQHQGSASPVPLSAAVGGSSYTESDVTAETSTGNRQLEEAGYCQAGAFGTRCGNPTSGASRGTVDQCFTWAYANCPPAKTNFLWKPSEGGFCYCLSNNVRPDGSCNGSWISNNDYSTFVMYGGDNLNVNVKADTYCNIVDPDDTDSPTTNPTISPTVSLPSKFLLPPPQCTVDGSNNVSVGDVTCNFSNIDSPSDATVSMSVKAFDCITDYDSTPFGNTTVIANTAQDTGVTSFAAVADVDLASGYSGDVKFCVRTDLKDATTGETMVFRSEKIKVTFTYNGDFQVVGLTSTPFVGIGVVATSETKNFGVTATLCDSSGTTVSNPPPLALGTNLFVCIKTNVVGTKIPSIATFTAQKVNGSPYDVAAPSPNVVIRGLDSSDVKIVMNLPARFFADSDAINLTGNVIVERDSRRRLANPRDLNENSNADFGLTIQVEGTNINADDSVSVRAVVMSSFIVGIITLLFI